MKTVTLTPLQLQTLTAIQRHIAEHGRRPTVDELQPMLGLRSKHSAHCRVASLRQAGALVDAPAGSRGTIIPARRVQVVAMYE
jgi:SOS-response transcriptional repressor LexA